MLRKDRDLDSQEHLGTQCIRCKALNRLNRMMDWIQITRGSKQTTMGWLGLLSRYHWFNPINLYKVHHQTMQRVWCSHKSIKRIQIPRTRESFDSLISKTLHNIYNLSQFFNFINTYLNLILIQWLVGVRPGVALAAVEALHLFFLISIPKNVW